jgi:zinc protease
MFAAGRPVTASEPSATRPTKVTSVEGITEYRLDNGLRVLIFPDQSKPTVLVNITYLVGSRLEGYGETGMTHLLEHMMFKGTPSWPDVWKQLQDHGAKFNGSTWWDGTNYFEELPASSGNLEFALALEADRMVASKIAASDLAKEFSVVRNELEKSENQPDAVWA